MLTFHHRALAVFVLVTLWPNLAWSQPEKVGIVTTLVGNVTARRVILPESVPLKFKDDVFYEDTITTGDQSLARVLLGGKSIVTIRERSVLTITESPGRSFVNLESGKIGLAVARDRLAPGESVDIRTPNAVVGVRGTVVVTEVLPGASNIYFLRGSGECSVLDPRTGRRIGAPVIVKPFESFKVVGSIMRIDPIPPSQVGQITAGLEGKGFQHIEAGNKEQVKKQVIAATAAVVGALASGAAVAISEERAMEDQGRDLRVVVPTTGCCPPTPLLPTPLPPPPSPSPINTFPPNITIDPALIPYTAATAQAPIPVVLIPTGTGLLTIPANAFEITAAMPTPVNLGRPLLQATLQTTDRGLVIGSSLLNVGGPFSSTTSLPVLSTDPTKIQTGADFIRIASGAQASVASSLVSDTGGKFDVGGSLIAVEGGGSLMSSSASPLIQLNTTNVKVAGDFVRLGSDGSAPGAAGSMLTIAGGSLLSLKNGSTASGLDGAFLTVSDGSVFNATPGSLATFGIGTNELRLQKAPLCSTGNCIRLFSTAYTILLRNGATVGNVFVDPAFVAFVGLGGDNTITGVDTGVDAKQALVLLDGVASRLNLGASVAISRTIGPGEIVDFNTGIPQVFSTLTVAGGTLKGSDMVTALNALEWTSGQIAGTGPLLVNGVIDLTTSGFKDLRGRTVTSEWRARLEDTGVLGMAQGAVFNNTGRFEALSGAGLENRFGGEATFLNAGTFVKTGAGTTTSISGVTFNNSGTVDVQSGTLSLAGGGTSSGRFTIGGGGTLEFAGGVSTLSTLTSASSVAGSGVLGFTGGTTDILGTYLATGPLLFTGGNATFITANSISTPSLTIRGGTGTFNSQLTADSVTLTGGTGTINSSLTAGSLSLSGGTLNIASAATLDLNGSTFKIIDGGVLNNAGVATWRSTGEFRLDSGGVINNTGRFEAQTDQAIVHTGPLGTVNNLGTFAKTGGTGTTSITANFNNTGRVDLLSGTLALSGGGLSSGTFNIAAGTSLALGPDPGVVGAAGLHDLTAAASLVGGGGVLVTQNVRFGAGSVYRLIGTTTLTSGTLTAIADLIALGAGETFSPSAAILVRNGGVVTVTGSFVDVAAGGALNGASAASLLVLNGGVGAGPATFGGLLHVVASSLANGPAVQAMVSLAGPLAMVTGSTLTTTSDLVGVLNGAQVVPPMPNPNLDQPFVTLDNSTVTAAGNVLTVRGSLAGVPSRMTLTGPLFVANNSSVSSAGGFVIDQGAELTGKSSGDLIRLVNSTFTSGPAALANFFAVFSDPLGTPSSVSLKGRLLSLDNGSTVSAPFSLLSVFRSSFSSDTSNALIEAVNSVLTLGRDSTQPGGQTLGRLLTVTASPTVPATVALSGPLAALTGTNVTATEILVGIFGGSVSRMTNGELIQLTDSTVKIGSSIPGQEIFGRALFITGQGGPDGTASLSLNGPLLSSLNGALTVTGRLVEILPGAQVTAGTGDAPLVSITGGIHSIGTLDGSSIFRVQGREGQEVLDEPLKTSRTLLATSGATISSPSGVNFDTMLFNATAPIFSAINSNLTLTSGPAISLNASTLSFKTSMNDAVISLAANSVLRVTGDLFSLSNGGKLIAMGGPLIRVDGSVLDVTGAFAAFRGTGNLISVNNNLCSTGCITFPGGSTGDITVKLVGPGSSAIIASNPFKGPGTGTLERIGNAAVIEVLNGGKVTIGPR